MKPVDPAIAAIKIAVAPANEGGFYWQFYWQDSDDRDDFVAVGPYTSAEHARFAAETELERLMLESREE